MPSPRLRYSIETHGPESSCVSASGSVVITDAAITLSPCVITMAGTTSRSKVAASCAVSQSRTVASVSAHAESSVNAVSTTFSASGIVRRLDQLKADILGGADGAFDTLKELQDALAGDASGIAALTRALESRVRFDEPQELTVESQAQARQNIGAVSAEAVGDTEVDFVVVFRDALAA